jgi:hypothetical protein
VRFELIIIITTTHTRTLRWSRQRNSTALPIMVCV